MSSRMFIGTILGSIGGAALVLASAASAQQGGGPPPVPTGGARSQDVAAANRQVDADYNTLAGRGVRVTDQSRAGSKPKEVSVVPATAADLIAGASVRDVSGVPIATIESLEDDGAVVRSEDRLAKLPFDSFGKDDSGLLIGITAAEFQAAIATTSVPVQEEPEFVTATAEDMTPGAAVRDIEGSPLGIVEELVDDGVIIVTDGRKVKLAIDSFAKDEQGLLIGITASELKALTAGRAQANTGG